jgi:hypothetical protein
MRQFPRVLAAALLAVVLAGCSLDYPASRKFAIIIGINNNPHTNPLSYCIADANSMAAMLAANGFAPADIWLLTEGGARRSDIEFALTQIAPEIGPHDLFVFYYSGHGFSGSSQGVDTQWIFPYDSVGASGSFIEAEVITDSELGTILGSLQTPRKVVILDSCNSGGFIGKGLEADTVPPTLYRNTTWAGMVTPATVFQAIVNYATFTTTDNGGISPARALTISAAGTEESSYEGDAPFNHGIMTYYLLQSPTAGDLNGDGFVTVLEAFALAKAGIDAAWNIAYAGTGAVFSPHVSGGPIDLVLF